MEYNLGIESEDIVVGYTKSGSDNYLIQVIVIALLLVGCLMVSSCNREDHKKPSQNPPISTYKTEFCNGYIKILKTKLQHCLSKVEVDEINGLSRRATQCMGMNQALIDSSQESRVDLGCATK